MGSSYISLCKKIGFQDGCHGGQLGFPIETILAIFHLQFTPMLPTKFRVNWPFTSGEEAKKRFSTGRRSGHTGLPKGTILAIFDLCFLPSFQSTALRFRGRSAKQVFKMAAILDFRSERFQLFLSYNTYLQEGFRNKYKSPDASYQVSSQLAFQFRRRSEK